MDRIGNRPDDPLTEAVIGCCFSVHNELGHGFLESVYTASLVVALQQQGLEVQREVPFQIFFRGQPVGSYRADVMVADRLLIEVKAVQGIAPEHLAQAINYLKVSRLPNGLVVNFGRPKVEIRRVYRPDSHPVHPVHPVPVRKGF